MNEDLSLPDVSSARASLPPFHGWQITLSNGRGPFGAETTLATAKKADTTISAAAWRPDIAMEMIQNMIRLRENIPPFRSDAQLDQ